MTRPAVFYPYRDDLDRVPAKASSIAVASWGYQLGKSADQFIRSNELDLEHWLEHAAMLVVLRGILGKRVTLGRRDEWPAPDSILFGDVPLQAIAFTGHSPAWPDQASHWHAEAYHRNPAFRRLARRRIEVAGELTPDIVGDVARAVQRFHIDGVPVVRLKYAAKQKYLPPLILKEGLSDGASLARRIFRWLQPVLLGLDEDGAPVLVQEEADVGWEYRTFVVDGRVVTGSPNRIDLTPWARTHLPLMDESPSECLRLTPEAPAFVQQGMGGCQGGDPCPREWIDYRDAAQRFADELTAADPHLRDFVMDVALINGRAGVIELNPIARSGLFAIDFTAVVKAALEAVERRQRRPVSAATGPGRA